MQILKFCNSFPFLTLIYGHLFLYIFCEFLLGAHVFGLLPVGILRYLDIEHLLSKTPSSPLEVSIKISWATRDGQTPLQQMMGLAFSYSFALTLSCFLASEKLLCFPVRLTRHYKRYIWYFFKNPVFLALFSWEGIL